jgi:hypothetical protein
MDIQRFPLLIQCYARRENTALDIEPLMQQSNCGAGAQVDRAN